MNGFESNLLALILMSALWLWIFYRYDVDDLWTSFVLCCGCIMIFVQFLLLMKFITPIWNIT